MSRAQVRSAVQQWFDPNGAWTNPPDQLDKVWTSFPKRIDFRADSRIAEIPTRGQAVVFIQQQSETRESIGGQHQGWKRVAYQVLLQVYCESLHKLAEHAMDDVDALADALHDRLVADHTLGQPATEIFTAGEPDNTTIFGEPKLNAAAATEQWFQISFTVVQWYQA